jgi:hypothetical protein
MHLKIPIRNRGYVQALEQIGTIFENLMANKQIEEIFNHYCELTNSDETAAILTLAEVIKGSDKPQAKAEDEAVATSGVAS